MTKQKHWTEFTCSIFVHDLQTDTIKAKEEHTPEEWDLVMRKISHQRVAHEYKKQGYEVSPFKELAVT